MVPKSFDSWKISFPLIIQCKSFQNLDYYKLVILICFIRILYIIMGFIILFSDICIMYSNHFSPPYHIPVPVLIPVTNLRPGLICWVFYKQRAVNKVFTLSDHLLEQRCAPSADLPKTTPSRPGLLASASSLLESEPLSRHSRSHCLLDTSGLSSL